MKDVIFCDIIGVELGCICWDGHGKYVILLEKRTFGNKNGLFLWIH